MLQISAATVLAVSSQQVEGASALRNLNEDEADVNTSESKVQITPYVMLVGMNLVPFPFAYALYHYRKSLKEKKTRKKVGSLY